MTLVLPPGGDLQKHIPAGSARGEQGAEQSPTWERRSEKGERATMLLKMLDSPG